MLRIKISKTFRDISRIYFWSTFIFLLPLLSTNLAFIGTDDGTCISYPVSIVQGNIYSTFTLGAWLYHDAYIKLAVLVFCLILSRTRRQCPEHEDIITQTQANILGLYWLFNLGWAIGGAVMFWGNIVGADCTISPSLNAYMYAALIINLLEVPIGIIISALRPEDEQNSHIVIAQNQGMAYI